MTTSRTSPNRLYFGDNLDILREHVADDSVDLIYLDPPFNSNANYNVLFREPSGEPSAAQITAFEDTWHWGLESEAAYRAVVTDGPQKLADLLQAMRAFLGQSDMMAYLSIRPASTETWPISCFTTPSLITLHGTEVFTSTGRKNIANSN